MPNIATVLRGEIVRLARKEIRAEVARLRRASSAYRSEIAALKKRLIDLERRARSRPKAQGAPSAQPAADSDLTGRRFSAKSMRSQRARLGLSAAEVGLLLGASAQSVYNWEEGKTRPQERHAKAIFAMRSLGRRDARRHLDSIAAASA